MAFTEARLVWLAFVVLLLPKCLCLSQAAIVVEEPSVATGEFQSILDRWTTYWGRSSKFMEVAGTGSGLDDVLHVCNHTAAVVALLGTTKPLRRNTSIGQPFLQIAEEVQIDEYNPDGLSLLGTNNSRMLQAQNTRLEDILGLPVLNKGISAVEAVLGRPLHALQIKVMAFPSAQSECRKPLAIWNVSSGTIYMDQQLFKGMYAHLEQIKKGTEALADTLTKQISKFIPVELDGLQKGDLWAKLVTAVAPAAMLVALGSQVPLWFCIACPVVLGFLVPFILNAGLGAAAEEICNHYALPADECNDLWYGAFAAAMILSFAAAIPIVYICQIPKCARGRAL